MVVLQFSLRHLLVVNMKKQLQGVKDREGEVVKSTVNVTINSYH